MKTIGVIGLGSIGMRHANNLTAMGHKVFGYDPETDKKYQYLGSLPHMINEADALVIASPTNSHLAHIIRGNENKRPMFVEKPIADRAFDINLNHVLMVGYNLRFRGAVKKALEWIKAGEIGQPLCANFVCAQYNDKAQYLSDGVTLNWSHEIDLALYMLGPARLVQSYLRFTQPQGIGTHVSDDIADLVLLHDNGCHTTVHLDYVTKPEIRTFRIVGNKGIIEANLVEGSNREPGMILLASDLDLRVREVFRPKDTFSQNYHEEMKAFIDRLDGKETIGCTGAEAVAVLRICLEAKGLQNP